MVPVGLRLADGSPLRIGIGTRGSGSWKDHAELASVERLAGDFDSGAQRLRCVAGEGQPCPEPPAARSLAVHAPDPEQLHQEIQADHAARPVLREVPVWPLP